MPRIYLIGSLRNAEIPKIAVKLRELGYEVFDDWFAPGPEADDWWKKYEEARGRTYKEALKGHAARHIFEFDKSHIDASDIGILVLPAGKSGHMELGYMIGGGKPGYVLMDRPDRWDVMYLFASNKKRLLIFFSLVEMQEYFRNKKWVQQDIRYGIKELTMYLKGKRQSWKEIKKQLRNDIRDAKKNRKELK